MIRILKLLPVIPIVWFLSTTASLASEFESRGPITIDNSEQFTVYSNEIGDTFRLDVILPRNYFSSDENFPVVYVTDSNVLSWLMAANGYLMRMGREIPEFVTVGIGYEHSTLLPGGRRFSMRPRDLTPPASAEYIADYKRRNEISEDIEPGNAEDFYQFIEREVKPFVNSNYQVNRADQTLVGYSLGGLFGTYVLFEHTESYDRYILGSPSLWWGNGLMLEYEENYWARSKELKKNIYISVGALESESMLTNNQSMFDRLNSRNYSGLNLETELIPRETHVSGLSTTLNKGLRSVFSIEVAQ